jgi:hypothetical protein
MIETPPHGHGHHAECRGVVGVAVVWSAGVARHAPWYCTPVARQARPCRVGREWRAAVVDEQIGAVREVLGGRGHEGRHVAQRAVEGHGPVAAVHLVHGRGRQEAAGWPVSELCKVFILDSTTVSQLRLHTYESEEGKAHYFISLNLRDIIVLH